MKHTDKMTTDTETKPTFDATTGRITDDFTISHLEHWIDSQFPLNRDEPLRLMLDYLRSLDVNDRGHILNNWSWWQVYDKASA